MNRKTKQIFEEEAPFLRDARRTLAANWNSRDLAKALDIDLRHAYQHIRAWTYFGLIEMSPHSRGSQRFVFTPKSHHV